MQQKYCKDINPIYNKILAGESILKELKEGYLIPVLKKGDKICSSFRGVTSLMIKLFGRSLRNGLQVYRK